ncbi:hypothetical protein WQ57_22835 [Mesobacillus campisalis]|uniref:Uncharacterized protein n=1 Tax=Mesobacillus campisalis TaxID=1408103 RepID=A0A0M2SL54_9BACI|nr:hypothetical protein WQ57_22835 [Mesobacillus campisalis]
MPVAPGQAASAFLIVQLRAPSAWVTSQSVQKVKEQPSSRLVLCLPPMNGALRFSSVQLQRLGARVISRSRIEGKERLRF